MQVSVEKVSNVERRLTIVVPADTVEQAYTQQIEMFAQKANIKGFRPGKAPMSVITQRYGDDARKEALSQVIQNALYQAIAEQKLKPVGAPQVEPKSILANQPLEFTATVEVLPEIEKVSFSLPTLEQLTVEVKDEDIQRVVDQLRKQYTKWNVVERAANKNDRVVIDYYAVFEGKSDEANKITNFPLELGANVMLPGFEDALVGLKAGDTKTVNLTFPDNVAAKDHAGKPVDFVVEVKQVFEGQAPEVNSDFVKMLGVKSGSAEDLTQQIKQSLEQERDRLVKENIKEQVFKALLEQNPIEIPKSLIAREAKNIHDEMYPQHQHHDHHAHSEEETAAFSEIAKKRVALGLLIAEFSKQAELKVDKDRVTKRIMEIASAYENPQEVINWLSADDRRSGVEAQVLEDQVMDKLIEGVSVTNKTMSYADLKGVRI